MEANVSFLPPIPTTTLTEHLLRAIYLSGCRDANMSKGSPGPLERHRHTNNSNSALHVLEECQVANSCVPGAVPSSAHRARQNCHSSFSSVGVPCITDEDIAALEG